MLATEPFLSPKTFSEAEHELGAFLRAAADLVGTSGLSRASDLWIDVMKDAGCPGPDWAKFFRTVTIRAIAQLAQNSVSWSLLPNQAADRPISIAA